jgi:hypothetical protein
MVVTINHTATDIKGHVWLVYKLPEQLLNNLALLVQPDTINVTLILRIQCL